MTYAPEECAVTADKHHSDSDRRFSSYFYYLNGQRGEFDSLQFLLTIRVADGDKLRDAVQQTVCAVQDGLCSVGQRYFTGSHPTRFVY